ncbi:MAG: Phosphoribosylformylglycinamidine synthase, glutamine amidotransferase subunit [Candidatus Ozemobacter sibiricus]|jgi:phosphoribosylformylglycinamidine synthase|uniref:Phosphoribosylformylglycinamidine synthase, glutamine amidotransferase subunit n=1 Tax=Candidatus Ozemobacter sibiricus TaxID=2268124 RepID=A0A367ZJV5_9BACT|nr:MAG: Phosphoribosylformylglycinamidine synthase, glutamine amidotransferase subunit [Candidatus Ozemobacter sibiricus]
MSDRPRIVIAAGCGINCEEELAAAWELAGADPEIVLLSDLLARAHPLAGAQAFCLPGGFSFGDDLGSGMVLACRLRHRRTGAGERFADHLRRFLERGGFVLGICNGFQVLVKMGALPNLAGTWTQEVTLAANASRRFENRWCHLRTNPDTPASWVAGLGRLELPVRHGEGRLLARDAAVLAEIRRRGLDFLHYTDEEGRPTATYPANPNGSEGAIAGLVDPSGRIIGLMPHPEAFLHSTLHPDWAGRRRRGAADDARPADGLRFFLAMRQAMAESTPLHFPANVEPCSEAAEAISARSLEVSA